MIAEFTGITSPYEPPDEPELVVETVGQAPPQSAEQILNYLRQHGLLKPATKVAQ